uniref:CENPB protein Homeodomainlike putative n=1 Tax=Albugo laibachii Nc14 TaxID=890382 RepID=F0WI71_9STRA|nr:CENPB protein Homeodomainlike putative [Albugo laibachii Nc14]|eukprot:CCA20949.1 CENPB protein Homeodomainlike putative [Albugo laibachii Nc14]
MLTRKSLQIANEVGVSATAFTASWTWRQAFLRRHKIAFHMRTRQGQISPAGISAKAAAFSSKLQQRMGELGVDVVYNADQTPVFFERIPTKTIEAKGTQTVWQQISAFYHFQDHDPIEEKTAAENNAKRHDFGKRLWIKMCDRQSTFGVQIYANATAWWNAEMSVRFLKYHFGELRERQVSPIFLLWDDFSTHWSERVRSAKEIGVVLMRVPPDYTSICQPADVSWNALSSKGDVFGGLGCFTSSSTPRAMVIREEEIERVLNAATVTKVANYIVPELEYCGGALVLSLLAAIATYLLATAWLVNHGSENSFGCASKITQIEGCLIYKLSELTQILGVAISYEHKHRIFMHWQKHPTMAWFQMQQWVQEQLGITLRRSTVQRVINMAAEVFMSINPLRKNSRSVKFPLFEKALIEFILAKQDVICLSDDLILEKALRLREQLKINESELHLWNGWLTKFSQDDVFNLDETALYYRLPPNKTLANIQVRKKVKQLVTIALCSNASESEKTKILVIGNAKSPRCFKGIDVEKKGVDYFASPKAWMNTTIFNKWLRKFNLLMHGRRVLLLLDNASSHKAICKHDNVEIVFLPPNMTSRIQPMDAGIIRSFKARYKKLFLRWCLDLVESNTVRKLNLLEAIEFSIESWRSVSEQVIRNCWVKTGLIDAIINAELQSTNDYRLNSIPFQREFAQLAELMAALGIRASIDDYIDAEDVEVVHEPPLANLDCSESDASDDSSDHEPVVVTAEALRCCIQLRSYFIKQDQDTSQEQAQLNKLMECVRQRKAKTAKQRNVDFFFKPIEKSS